jgi:hypothetical protein
MSINNSNPTRHFLVQFLKCPVMGYSTLSLHILLEVFKIELQACP